MRSRRQADRAGADHHHRSFGHVPHPHYLEVHLIRAHLAS
jgi:hypothetical protein